MRRCGVYPSLRGTKQSPENKGIRAAHLPISPRNNLVDDLLLLGGGAAQIDTGGLNAVVSHQVGKQGNVVAFLKEVLCEAMSERVRVYHFGVQPVLEGESLQTTGKSARQNYSGATGYVYSSISTYSFGLNFSF
jgi:hypothetical protein